MCDMCTVGKTLMRQYGGRVWLVLKEGVRVSPSQPFESTNSFICSLIVDFSQ